MKYILNQLKQSLFMINVKINQLRNIPSTDKTDSDYDNRIMLEGIRDSLQTSINTIKESLS